MFDCEANNHSLIVCVSRSLKASESGLSLAVYPKEAEVVADLVTKEDMEEVEVEEMSSRRVNMVTTIRHNWDIMTSADNTDAHSSLCFLYCLSYL